MEILDKNFFEPYLSRYFDIVYKTIEDLKNDFEETEKLMEEDKKKYLEHLKKQSADMNEYFQKEN